VPPGAPPSTWPFSVAFPRRGTFSGGGGGSVGLEGYHTIVVQLHYARKNQEQAYARIVPYLEPVIKAITDDPTLTGSVTTIDDQISYTFGGLTYAAIETIGWEFEIPVKIRYSEEAD
jgi:hypothetical protein